MSAHYEAGKARALADIRVTLQLTPLDDMIAVLRPLSMSERNEWLTGYADMLKKSIVAAVGTVNEMTQAGL